MKDITIPDPNDRKKIMFYDTPQRHAQLKIRCSHDGINQSQFLRMMVTGYIENDSHVVEFINECKEKYKLQGKSRRTKSLKLQRHGEQLSKDLALGEDEIENIFDILENDI
jgi:predicted Zn-dependent peptidase